MRRLALSFMLAVLAASPAAAEQDLLLGADMSSPAMTKAEMSRADVEALIVSVPTSGQSPRCFVVPIDACYELVGRLRTVWRGFDGGQDAARAVDEFFGRVEARSRSA